LTAKVEIDKGLQKEWFEFLKTYPANFGFLCYSTYSGNRVSIEILFTPDKELEEHGQWRGRWLPTGFEIMIGTVHVVLAHKERSNIKRKVDKIVAQTKAIEQVVRKYGYPYEGLWELPVHQKVISGYYKEQRKKMMAELEDMIKGGN
jgi:hypothetical protein